MKFLQLIFRKTLNNVLFGVAIMVLTGAYIAIGSGLPRVREFFEMNDLQFFNAWPLKVLMVLLVANLCVVTWVRIPLTLPRLGVWMIHTGIVMLIVGTSFYYRHKVEGQTYIQRGQTVSGFYDSAERALFVRLNGQPIYTDLSLPSLPRFNTYAAGADPQPLRRDLANLPLVGLFRGEGDQPVAKKVSAVAGLKDDLTVDVVGYHPYADLQIDYVEDPASDTIGVRLSVPDPHGGQTSRNWLVSADPQSRAIDLGGVTVEHRHLPTGPPASLIEAASQLHRIDVKAGDYTQSLFVQVGQKYDLGATGYSVTVENFNPAFPMSGTGELVKILTLLVKNTDPKAPATEFRRMVIDGNPLQTDFKLNESGAGPMGKRQKAPLDEKLQLLYAFNDPNRLVPTDGGERHLLITADQPGITHLQIGVDGSAKEQPLSPTGEFNVGPAEVKMKLSAVRMDHLRRREAVVDVPPVKRVRDLGATGVMQIATLRVKSGDWSQIVNVPYVPFALEPNADWRTVRSIDLPGTMSKLQIALGNTRLELPAKLTLQNFELVNYPGGTINDNLFRDFKSTLKVVSRETGEEEVGVAKMNSPIYFDGGNWLLFQSGYNKQEMSTFIGVGNRPGVGVMTAGCILMAVGLLYAFYVKPVIIRRRKEKAIALAAAGGKLKKPGETRRAATIAGK